MENKSQSPLQFIITSGIIVALTGIILQVIIYVLDMALNWWPGILFLLIQVVIATLLLKNYRDKQQGGFISYGRALWMGTAIFAIAFLLSNIYNYIFMHYIDPEFSQKALDYAREKMLDSGLSEDKANEMMTKTKESMNPSALGLVKQYLISILFGFILSLITGLIVRKNDNSFENNMAS